MVRFVAVIGMLLCVGCGGGGGGFVARDLAVKPDGGACNYVPNEMRCATSNGSTMQAISCTDKCCRCVENNLITKTCAPPDNIIDPCGANNCCGFAP